MARGRAGGTGRCAIERAESENINALINKPEEKSSEARIATRRGRRARAPLHAAGQETTVGSRTVNFGSRAFPFATTYTQIVSGAAFPSLFSSPISISFLSGPLATPDIRHPPGPGGNGERAPTPAVEVRFPRRRDLNAASLALVIERPGRDSRERCTEWRASGNRICLITGRRDRAAARA